MVVRKALLIPMLLLLSATVVAQGAAGTYVADLNSGFGIPAWLRQLGWIFRIAALVVLVIIILYIYLRMRNTRKNNLRRSRKHHQKALQLHEKGNETAADKHYHKADHYRQKAEE